MLSLWGVKSSSLLGIDIGSSSVKLIELGKQGTGYSVLSFGQASIPTAAVESKAIKNPDAVVEAIGQALKACRSGCDSVATAVADATVITRTVQLEEGLSDQEAEELVILEADKYIPYPIDEVSIDYQFIGPSSKGGSLQDVLVVASRTENVNARVELLKQCGLDVRVVDVESFAVARACEPFFSAKEGSDSKLVAVFDVGDACTHLTVLQGERVVFSREDIFGGKQLTEDIAKRYGMSLSDAEAAKRGGNLPDDYDTELLQPYREMISLQLRRALQFFFSTSQHSTLDQIYLAGGAAVVPQLVNVVEKVLEIPTSLVDPIAKMTFSKDVDKQKVQEVSPSLMLATGLAMRKFEAS